MGHVWLVSQKQRPGVSVGRFQQDLGGWQPTTNLGSTGGNSGSIKDNAFILHITTEANCSDFDVLTCSYIFIMSSIH